jgi:hypothetical protein
MQPNAAKSAGCGIPAAARHVCCAPSTIRREAIRNTEFHEQLRRAELTAQLTPLRAMQQAAATHWCAAAWLLERTDPQQFGRRNPHQPSIEDLEALFEEIFEVINNEITDPELSRHVYNRLIAKFNSDRTERWSARHHRRDPARAKRFLPPFNGDGPDTPDHDNESTPI